MRVLVAEDEKKIALHIRAALREQGFAVDMVHRGDEALEAALSTPYDALVLDVMMPGRDGLSILRSLRDQRVATPVLIVTARGEVSERVEGLMLGADDYLSKPFAMNELVMLKEPPHDATKWKVLQPTDDPQWLEKSTVGGAWDTAYLHIDYATALEKSQPAAAALLSKVKLDTSLVSAFTKAIVVDKMDPAAFAKKWVADNGALVDSWLK